MTLLLIKATVNRIVCPKPVFTSAVHMYSTIAVIDATYAVAKRKPEKNKFRLVREYIFFQALYLLLHKLCL